jgi:hypothetical protein
VHIELPVNAIHAPGIEEYQCNEYVDRTLLGEPESQFEAPDANLVQLLDKQQAKTIGTDEPDSQAERDQTQVGPPIGRTILGIHACQFTKNAAQVTRTKKRLLAEPLL